MSDDSKRWARRQASGAWASALLTASGALSRCAAMLAAAVIGAGLTTAPAAATDTKATTAAQALVAATDLSCTVSAARRADSEEIRSGGGGRHGGRTGGGMSGGGMNRSLDGDGQTPRQGRPTAYEVACQEGMGFILLDTARPRDKGRADPVQYLNCLEAKEAADERVLPYQCRLKENHDADRGMQALATHAGLDCDVTAARGLGHTEDKSFFEIACARPAAQLQKGPTDNGWVLVTTRAVLGDRPVSAFSCFDTEGMPKLRCHLTNVHGTIEALRRFVVKTDPGCAPVKQRLVGPSRGGGEVFEVACRNGDGYMAHRASDRSFDTAVACRDAALTGRCRLVAAEPKS